MHRWTSALAAALLSIAAPALAQTTVTSVDVNGDWDVTIQSPQGSNTIRATFKQDGEKLSGVLKSRVGELPFEGGTMTGDDLKFSFTIPVQGMQLEITLNGKVEGSSIAGKAQFGGFGEGDWSAKRVETTTAAASDAAPSTPAAPAAPATPAAASGLSGHWDVTVKTQMGDVPITADIVETDGKITGTITGPQGSVDIGGTHDGTMVKLEFVAKMPQGDIPITMTGDVNGDAIAGKAEFGGMGQGEWTAKRKP
jgi:hypothetical protein